jgi:hypothetical protein
MAAPDEAEPVQDPCHAQRDRRLSGARIAGEGHMQGRKLAGQAHLLADALDQKQRGNLANPRLDRLEADEFAVELRQHLLDADRFEFPPQIHALRGR